MGRAETVEVTGHLMDAGILSRILDDIRDYGGDYVIEEFDVGHEAHDRSRARITVQAEDDESLQRLLMRLQTRGVNQVDPGDAATATAEQDGVLPDGFYSTTNLATRVRIDGALVRRGEPRDGLRPGRRGVSARRPAGADRPDVRRRGRACRSWSARRHPGDRSRARRAR